MKKTTRNVLFLLITVIMVFAFFMPAIFSDGMLSDQLTSTAGKSVLPVEAIVLQPETIRQTVRTSGTLLPNEEVDLFSETSGRITHIYFKEGSPVKKGQLLVKINDAELAARLQKSMYDKKLAEELEFRKRQQLEAKLLSQEEYDVALNAVNTFQAEIDLIKAQIAKTEIRAPFSGVVGLKYVSEGSYISTNKRIASLIDTNPVKIEFSIPEKYAGLVGKGNPITFSVQGNPDIFKAQVFAVQPRIDASTRTITMRAVTPNVSGKLIPGSFAQIELVVNEKNNILMIPSQAVIPELGGQKVFLYQGGIAEPVVVETGIRTERKIEISSGLQAGDTLITSGMLQLRLGLAVEISGFDVK